MSDSDAAERRPCMARRRWEPSSGAPPCEGPDQYRVYSGTEFYYRGCLPCARRLEGLMLAARTEKTPESTP